MGVIVVKRLHVDSTFRTRYLLDEDLVMLKHHLSTISERIYEMEKKINVDMAYQTRLERIIRIKETIELEEAEE